jgi:hypothetical protein
MSHFAVLYFSTFKNSVKSFKSPRKNKEPWLNVDGLTVH